MLRTLTLACSWATILNCISRVIAFLFFPPEAGDTWAFCRHEGIQKHKTQYLKPPGNTVSCRVSGVYPHDPVTDRELQPAATAQCQVSIGRCMASPGKDQNSKFKFQFLVNVYHFHTIVKSKNRKLNHDNSGTALRFYNGLIPGMEIAASPSSPTILIFS